MASIALIVKNTVADKSLFHRHLQEFKALIFPAHSLHVFYTQYAGHARELATEFTRKEYNFILSVGGDGTLHEIVDGIMQVNPMMTPTVAVLPYGSGNDFCKNLKGPHTLPHIAQLILSPTRVWTDLGRITIFDDQHQVVKTEYFCNVASAGISGLVVQKVNSSARSFHPDLTYFKAILASFFSYKKVWAQVVADDWEWEGPLMLLAVGNGKWFGSGLAICPDAQLNDGRFQVTVAGNISLWDYLKNIPTLKKGRHIRHAEVSYRMARKLRISFALPAGQFEADGEWVGNLCAEMEVVPARLPVLGSLTE
jgi:diacylglycerol kinase (ATP)